MKSWPSSSELTICAITNSGITTLLAQGLNIVSMILWQKSEYETEAVEAMYLQNSLGHSKTTKPLK